MDCIVKEQHITVKMNRIPNFSNLHNSDFTQEGLPVWKAFNVGKEITTITT